MARDSVAPLRAVAAPPEHFHIVNDVEGEVAALNGGSADYRDGGRFIATKDSRDQNRNDLPQQKAQMYRSEEKPVRVY